MGKHVFTNHCVDFEELLKAPNITKMLKIAYDQSKTAEAKLRVDFAKFRDYGTDEFCPRYFGMFTEWFCGHFLEYFGHNFNLENVQMLDVEGNAEQDSGVDGTARNLKKENRKSFIRTGRQPVQGSPVYIQVKGTRDITKLYSPNDGTRLPNFMTHAQGKAMLAKQSYKARYILFTTGEGIDYKMENMACHLMEVINHRDIKRWADDNIVFLNKMREEVGLELLDIPEAKPDVDAPIFDENMDISIYND